MSYERFAYLYDELMKDVPYEKWVELIQEQSEKHHIAGKKLLDLACGTGELSVRLANKGYEVTGVDLSDDMLTVAQNKASDASVTIQFLQQNMAELELIDTFDMIGIFCDSLNYLQTAEEVKQTFERVKQYLNRDGLFIFDVHSLFKMNEIFIDQTYTYDDEGICYIWNCFEGEFPDSVDHELTFFVEDKAGKYDRFDENHTQRTFSVETYQHWLAEAGFQILEMFGDFDEALHPQSERIFFVCKHI